MLKGYADAYRVFGEKRFLEKAVANANFILTKVSKGDRLYRNYKNGKAIIDAFLDDYALAIEAFIALYEATFDEQWLNHAHRWTEYVIQHFRDEKSGMFYYTSDVHEDLIARKMELSDKVRLEIGVSDSFVDRTVQVVLASARTGDVGDGKVFVLPVDHVYRIRTGEHDELAVTPEPRHGEVHPSA